MHEFKIFLSYHRLHETIWIYLFKTKNNTRWILNPIQHWPIRSQRICVRRIHKRNVRNTRSRGDCKLPIIWSPRTIWVRNRVSYIRTMVAQVKSDLLHIGFWWLWSKIHRENNSKHLINYLLLKKKVTIEWEVKLYAKITLKWDYENKTVDLYIPFLHWIHNLKISIQSQVDHTTQRTRGSDTNM